MKNKINKATNSIHFRITDSEKNTLMFTSVAEEIPISEMIRIALNEKYGIGLQENKRKNPKPRNNGKN